MNPWIVLGVAAFVMGGLAVSLLVLGLARAGSGADHDWQLYRIERKLDLILTHLSIAHDDHVPTSVIELVRAGRKLEAVAEYERSTGSKPRVARREIDFLISKFEKPADGPPDQG